MKRTREPEDQTERKKSNVVTFTDDDHKVKTARQLLADVHYYPRDYDPPVWDPLKDDDFDADETMMFYGQRRDGKSTLARYLALLLRRYFPLVYVFSGTAMNNFWQQVLPANKVIQINFTDKDTKEATLNAPCRKLLELNAARVTLWKQAAAQRKAQGNPTTLVIGDDAVTDDTIRECKSATQVMLNGRHHGIPAWILSQVWVGLTPSQRKNLDRLILFKATDFNVEKWVLDTYGQHVVDMYRRVTSEPFTAFVIVNKSRIKGPRFYKFKADVEWVESMLARNVVLGNKRTWEGIDVAEQKRHHPDVSLHGKRLKNHFNEDVGFKDEKPEEDNDDILNVEPEEDVEEGPPIEVFRSW